MRLKYVGVHTEGVEIPSLGITVAHGEIVEVDDATGKGLAADTNEWQVTSRSSKKGDEE
jgi:hypothetical protein